jgi:hypothetical protein
MTGPATGLPPGARDPELDHWASWTPRQVVHVLAGVEAPWYVAAGWAISLHLGEVHREHEDLEIAVPAERFAEVAAALADYDLFVPGRAGDVGYVQPLASAAVALADSHQTWVRDHASGHWRLDVFREPSRAGEWVCRRDESMRLPYERVVARTADGIPYARPEIALLFKAKHVRDKDEVDFMAVLPTLEPDARAWLAQALERIHPGHAWLELLAS